MGPLGPGGALVSWDSVSVPIGSSDVGPVSPLVGAEAEGSSALVGADVEVESSPLDDEVGGTGPVGATGGGCTPVVGAGPVGVTGVTGVTGVGATGVTGVTGPDVSVDDADEVVTKLEGSVSVCSLGLLCGAEQCEQKNATSMSARGFTGKERMTLVCSAIDALSKGIPTQTVNLSGAVNQLSQRRVEPVQNTASTLTLGNMSGPT